LSLCAWREPCLFGPKPGGFGYQASEALSPLKCVDAQIVSTPLAPTR